MILAYKNRIRVSILIHISTSQFFNENLLYTRPRGKRRYVRFRHRPPEIPKIQELRVIKEKTSAPPTHGRSGWLFSTRERQRRGNAK